MPLESCMILLDCSQYMRNGDYIPTRLEAQQDAANMLIGAKTQSNKESTVGVSAGTDILVSPTDDVGKILSAVHKVKMSTSDNWDIPTAVSVASLALKHRRNKNGVQRIVLFVGTPVTADVKALQKAGRLLKKNNVAIDVVALGELEQNEAVLQELVDAANGRAAASEDSERTCHLVSIPPGVLPSDVLASSPVLAGSGGAFAAAAAAGGFGGGGGGGGANDDGFDFGGVDPNMDPELAMALRVSMEEERARQERVAAAAAASGDTDMPDAAVAAAESAASLAAAAGLSDEEALLQQALAMSMNENDPEDDNPDSKPSAGAGANVGDDEMEEEDDDEAMQMALQMSMATDDETTPPTASAAAASSTQFQDPAFINQMLQDMPGVDPNDPNIQEILKKAAEDKKKKDGE
jgi:26S proteasome regulatory subunit N10